MLCFCNRRVIQGSQTRVGSMQCSFLQIILQLDSQWPAHRYPGGNPPSGSPDPAPVHVQGSRLSSPGPHWECPQDRRGPSGEPRSCHREFELFISPPDFLTPRTNSDSDNLSSAKLDFSWEVNINLHSPKRQDSIWSYAKSVPKFWEMCQGAFCAEQQLSVLADCLQSKSVSCWTFSESYSPPVPVPGAALFAPVRKFYDYWQFGF